LSLIDRHYCDKSQNEAQKMSENVKRKQNYCIHFSHKTVDISKLISHFRFEKSCLSIV
jgi:hypothetical protein